MDRGLFEQGKAAYGDGDYRAAARSFLAAAGETVEDAGEALHWAGNALMRLSRFDDASTAYEHALEDTAYPKSGSVAANLGAAYRASGRYDEAVDAYEIALRSSDYSKPWKAYLGKAGALYEMGRLDESAGAYRFAALEAGNPDPGKALNNLGLCYMAVGRADDAVEAYSAAASTVGYAGAGRAAANLGLALSTLGRHEEALRAFRKAMDDEGFELSGGLEDAFRFSTDAVASASTAEPAEPEVVAEEPTDVFAAVDEPHSDFFTRTDAEMRELDRQTRRDERKSRPKSTRLAPLIAGGIAVIVVFAVAAWAWFSGFGYPSQTATVEGLMEAFADGEDYSNYWVAVPETDIEQEMLTLPQNYMDYEIGTVDSDAAQSRVSVTVTLEGGAPLQYEFTLAREGVGWKVMGVDNDWRSTGGGA